MFVYFFLEKKAKRRQITLETPVKVYLLASIYKWLQEKEKEKSEAKKPCSAFESRNSQIELKKKGSRGEEVSSWNPLFLKLPYH